MMTLTAARLPVLAALLLGTIACAPGDDWIPDEDAPESDQAAVGGALVRGVKWKQEMAAQDEAKSARLETDGLSYADAAQQLVANGVTEVVLRIPGKEIFKKPNGDFDQAEFARWDEELIKMVKALKQASPTVRVYLWKRQWMQRRNDQGVVVDTDGVDELATQVAKAVERAEQEGVGDVIAGVAAIETNIETSRANRRLSLAAAARINDETDGWLRGKTFMMPGAGMGSYFKGIGHEGGQFFDRMDDEVGRFSFIYKHMTPCESGGSSCSIQGMDQAWEHHVGKDSSVGVDAQVKFLRKHMGLGDLKRYLRKHQSQHPELCNVTFWGDQGDGVILMSDQNLAAVHRVLVEHGGYRDHFFGLPYVPPGATPHQAKKYLLEASGDGQVSRHEPSWKTWTPWSEEAPLP